MTSSSPGRRTATTGPTGPARPAQGACERVPYLARFGYGFVAACKTVYWALYRDGDFPSTEWRVVAGYPEAYRDIRKRY